MSFILGHVLDKAVFGIKEDKFRYLYCLIRITGTE